MNQKNVPNDTCPTCKKAWLTNHTLASVSPDGKLSIHCHAERVGQTDFVLKYVLDQRAAKLEAQSEVVALKKKAVLERQAIGAELKREFDSMVDAEANKRVVKDIAALEADHRKALADGEKARAQLVSDHDAKLLDLQDLLKEVRGANQTLHEEKTSIAGKLAASERKIIDQQLEIVELTASCADLTARHKGLKKRSQDMIRTLVSLGTRIAFLEQESGVVPKVDPERIGRIVMGEEYDDVGVPIDELRDDPTPIPPPAPKADVTTAPVAAPQAAPAPVPPTNVVVLDDPEPEPESSASADDEDDGHDHDVDDADAEEREAASDEDDDESSESEECSLCDQPATEEMSFVKKDGTDGKLAACDPSKHADAFLGHLKKVAKNAPESAVDVITLFNPIQ